MVGGGARERVGVVVVGECGSGWVGGVSVGGAQMNKLHDALKTRTKTLKFFMDRHAYYIRAHK